MKYKFTKEDVERVYDEVERRIQIDVRDDCFDTQDEIIEYRNAMLQGVYGTLMVLASNWPDVRSMTDVIEEAWHWKFLGYPEED